MLEMCSRVTFQLQNYRISSYVAIGIRPQLHIAVLDYRAIAFRLLVPMTWKFHVCNGMWLSQ